MTKATFEIKTGIADHGNDIIQPGALRIPDKKIPVLLDFDASFNGLIGQSSVTESNGVINIDAEFNREIDLENFSHGIGYKVLKFETDQNGHRVIKDAKLYCVGITGKWAGDSGDSGDSSMKKSFSN